MTLRPGRRQWCLRSGRRWRMARLPACYSRGVSVLLICAVTVAWSTLPMSSQHILTAVEPMLIPDHTLAVTGEQGNTGALGKMPTQPGMQWEPSTGRILANEGETGGIIGMKGIEWGQNSALSTSGGDLQGTGLAGEWERQPSTNIGGASGAETGSEGKSDTQIISTLLAKIASSNGGTTTGMGTTTSSSSPFGASRPAPPLGIGIEGAVDSSGSGLSALIQQAAGGGGQTGAIQSLVAMLPKLMQTAASAAGATAAGGFDGGDRGAGGVARRGAGVSGVASEEKKGGDIDLSLIATQAASSPTAAYFGGAAPSSLPGLFHSIFSTIAQGILKRVGDSGTDAAKQMQMRGMYRRMLLVWKDLLQSDIGNGNPLIASVVSEWMRDLIPLQIWSSVSYSSVSSMARFMEHLLSWAQTDESCVPAKDRACNVDPIKMQFAVEMMRASMPLILTGQLHVGVVEKFLATYARISKVYPRVGFQVLGLLRANPPLVIESITHIFAHDNADELDAITGTVFKWGDDSRVTFYQEPNCIGASYKASVDAGTIDMCSETFSNGNGVNLSAKSVKLSPDTFLKLIHCPDKEPANKGGTACSGNLDDDCETLCQYDDPASYKYKSADDKSKFMKELERYPEFKGHKYEECVGMCLLTKYEKTMGFPIEGCAKPVTVQCLKSYISEECFNIDWYHTISYATGKNLGADGAGEQGADEAGCPAVPASNAANDQTGLRKVGQVAQEDGGDETALGVNDGVTKLPDYLWKYHQFDLYAPPEGKGAAAMRT